MAIRVALDKARHSAEQYQACERELLSLRAGRDAAILAASSHGASLAQIAGVVGMSRMGVSKVLARRANKDEDEND